VFLNMSITASNRPMFPALTVVLLLTNAATADLITSGYENGGIPKNRIIATSTANVVRSNYHVSSEHDEGFLALSASTALDAATPERLNEPVYLVSMNFTSTRSVTQKLLEFSSEFQLGKSDVSLAELEKDIEYGRSSMLTLANSQAKELMRSSSANIDTPAVPKWFTLGSVDTTVNRSDTEAFWVNADEEQLAQNDENVAVMARPSVNPFRFASAEISETNQTLPPVGESPGTDTGDEQQERTLPFGLTAIAIPEPGPFSIMMLLITGMLAPRRRTP
jgi:hypothetical protein